MTLLRKFGVLLAVLGLMVVLNLGTSLWAVSILRREVSVYLHSISEVLGGINAVKRDLSEIAASIPPQGPPPGDGQGPAQEPVPWAAIGDDSLSPQERARDFEERRARIAARFSALRASGTFSARSGISARLNLEQRVEEALADSARWFGSITGGGGEGEVGTPDVAAARRAREQLFALHELIERTETKILGDARQAVLHGRDIRARVISVMLVTLAVTFAAGLLALTLVQRWVVRPVTELRVAAGRIAAGDFAHRIPVQGGGGTGGKGDELAMLSAEVNHMAGMVSAMQEERVERERLAAVGEMVRRLAHNLRNPLAGIRSLAELTKGDLTPEDPAQENQDRIISTVDRFEGWLAEMLSATTPLELRPARTAAAPWLQAVIEPLRPMAAAKGVEIRLDAGGAPAEAVFDAGHLEQALVGVVTNAIQVSNAGQTVTVSARGGEAEAANPKWQRAKSKQEPPEGGNGGVWEIRVADRGPGVPPELADRIFRPYFTTRKDGTGIGLAVARQVVEQHGGRISVGNARAGLDEPEIRPSPPNEGVGAEFVIRLPVQGPKRLASPSHSPPFAAPLGASLGQDSDSRG